MEMIRRLSYIVAFVFLVAGCGSNPLDVNVSGDEISIGVLRMEQDLVLEIGSEEEANKLNTQLLEKYGVLYELFITKFIQEGSVHDPMIGEYLLRRFKTDILMKEVVPLIKERFSDFSSHKKGIEEALKRCKHHFPDTSLPDNIVTFFSYFNAPAMVVENNLCIGVEMYLGAEHKSIKKLPIRDFPQFFKDKLDEKYLVSNAVKAWLLERFYKNTGDDFLDKIVSAGKIMYLMDAMLPNTSDELKMSYSEEEVAWAVKNENSVWEQMVSQEILYKKDALLEDGWIKDGPFTKGLPDHSPARMGIWMGWQMVKDYMKKKPEVSLTDLVNESNAKRILKHYDPKG